jgi:hypothetical protein
MIKYIEYEIKVLDKLCSSSFQVIKIGNLEQRCEDNNEWEEVVVEADKEPFEAAVHKVQYPT